MCRWPEQVRHPVPAPIPIPAPVPIPIPGELRLGEGDKGGARGEGRGPRARGAHLMAAARPRPGRSRGAPGSSGGGSRPAPGSAPCSPGRGPAPAGRRAREAPRAQPAPGTKGGAGREAAVPGGVRLAARRAPSAGGRQHLTLTPGLLFATFPSKIPLPAPTMPRALKGPQTPPGRVGRDGGGVGGGTPAALPQRTAPLVVTPVPDSGGAALVEAGGPASWKPGRGVLSHYGGFSGRLNGVRIRSSRPCPAQSCSLHRRVHSCIFC